MLAISLVVVGMLLCCTACNPVGPYYGSVYRLDDSTYRVNLSTWIGGGSGLPREREELRESEELQRKAEGEARAALRRVGIEVDACVFHRFVPYEGGHTVICLIAGKKEAVGRWIAMPDIAYDQWLRDHYRGDSEIAEFEGRLPK